MVSGLQASVVFWEVPAGSLPQLGLFSLQAPLLPRLGLLALACSDGKVLLFSLPHPEALLALQPPGEQQRPERGLPVHLPKVLWHSP